MIPIMATIASVATFLLKRDIYFYIVEDQKGIGCYKTIKIFME